jgi:hypothetical protein
LIKVWGLKRSGSFDGHRMFLVGNSVTPKTFDISERLS